MISDAHFIGFTNWLIINRLPGFWKVPILKHLQEWKKSNCECKEYEAMRSHGFLSTVKTRTAPWTMMRCTIFIKQGFLDKKGTTMPISGTTNMGQRAFTVLQVREAQVRIRIEYWPQQIVTQYQTILNTQCNEKCIGWKRSWTPHKLTNTHNINM